MDGVHGRYRCAGYRAVIKIDYSHATNKYQLQGTVENKYADTSLQVFTTNTELCDLINGGYNYTIICWA